MLLKEKIGFNLYERLLRSTVSPWGENKRGDFLQVLPPPNPRRPDCIGMDWGTSSASSTIIVLEHIQSDYYPCALWKKRNTT